MKIRINFVSNSSSSSFLIGIPINEKSTKCPHCGREDLNIIQMLQQYGHSETEIGAKNDQILKGIEKNINDISTQLERLKYQGIFYIESRYPWIVRDLKTEEAKQAFMKKEIDNAQFDLECLIKDKAKLEEYQKQYNLYKIYIDNVDLFLLDEVERQFRNKTIINLEALNI